MSNPSEQSSPLITEFNFGEAGDDIYEALLRAHDGLSEEESHRLNARLILILANHIGDEAVLTAALGLARSGFDGQEDASG